jgi:hypothetical protein
VSVEPERSNRSWQLGWAEALRKALRLWLQQQTPDHGQLFGLWRDRPQPASGRRLGQRIKAREQPLT